jgi:hypothetical protein
VTARRHLKVSSGGVSCFVSRCRGVDGPGNGSALARESKRPLHKSQLRLALWRRGDSESRETKRCVSTITATTHRRRPDAAGFLLERGDDLPKEHDLLATDCEVSRQAAVPESAERIVCRRGAGKIAKSRGQMKYEPPIPKNAILARLPNGKMTCSFRAQRCQREERHVHTEASHFSQPAAWD